MAYRENIPEHALRFYLAQFDALSLHALFSPRLCLSLRRSHWSENPASTLRLSATNYLARLRNWPDLEAKEILTCWLFGPFELRLLISGE